MKEQLFGRRVWFFPDGDIPPPGPGALIAHEALVILNPGDEDARIAITVYYPDREPDHLPPQTVQARRVRCIRSDEGFDGVIIPYGQYALRLESTVPVIAQMGRMDVRQPNLAYYTVMGFPG